MSGPAGTIGGAVAIAATLAVAAAVAFRLGPDTPARRQAIILAAVAVGAGAVGGWLVSRWSRRRTPALAVAGGLGGTLVRLVPGLGLLAGITSSGGVIREAGAAGFVVAFYLVALAASLVLHVAGSEKARPDRRDGRAN